jgi:hypothetical protein
MSRYLFAALFLFLSTPSFAVDLGDEISLDDFVTAVGGDYEILKADGKETKYKEGSVVGEKDEVVLSFPYCPEDGDLCDSGYIFLPRAPATAVKINKLVTKTETTYTIRHTDGLDKYNYEWIVPVVKKDPHSFRRYDYVYGTRKPFTLEFSMTPKPVVP